MGVEPKRQIGTGDPDMGNVPLLKSKAGGLAGDHAKPAATPVLVATSTNGECNTIGVRLVPVACWHVEDMRFEFGSSFVQPDLRDELQVLHELMQAHPGAPLSIFGHADPIGQDESNKKLSGRRAQAVYALLTRNTELWEELYTNPYQSDKWDTDEIQIMLTALGYYAGPINGQNDETTKQATKTFQSDQGLETDGVVGKNTRPKLFAAYMDAICVDQRGSPYQLDPGNDFLARGADPQGKGDYQGCGEFNPRMLFSQAEQQKFQKAENKVERDEENSINRRVIVLLFRPESYVHPKNWPCPRVKDGVSGCKKRFWTDGEDRCSQRLPDERREYRNTNDTFACRFYDRHARLSPCEQKIASGYGSVVWYFNPLKLKVKELVLNIRNIKSGVVERLRPSRVETNGELVFDLSTLNPKFDYEIVPFDSEQAMFLPCYVQLARLWRALEDGDALGVINAYRFKSPPNKSDTGSDVDGENSG